MPRKTDKRIRLVDAAKKLIHQQGFNLTTLADIAQEADVPLGNVYYYFKTKEAIGEAVIEKWSQDFFDRSTLWEENTTPAACLVAMIEHELESADATARYGCPLGGLCQELAKQGGMLADSAAKLLNDTLEWTEKHFRALGYSETAREFALQIVSRIQGMSLMTNTFRDAKLAHKLGQGIINWIEDLAKAKGVDYVTTTTTTSTATATAMA